MSLALSEQIVDALLRDLKSRKGLRQEWEAIDGERQRIIRSTWIGRTVAILNEAKGKGAQEHEGDHECG
jgi:hypothetical protein